MDNKELDLYPGYEITPNGELVKTHTGRISRGSITANKHVMMCLTRDGENYKEYACILVAEAFLPNPNNYTNIKHKDGDFTNNAVDNLEWCEGNFKYKFKRYGGKTYLFEQFDVKKFLVYNICREYEKDFINSNVLNSIFQDAIYII